jgi:glutamyl-tRNA synthetase
VLEALGFDVPEYAHCSLILGEDRSKLSKRHGATSCNQFRQEVRSAQDGCRVDFKWC